MRGGDAGKEWADRLVSSSFKKEDFSSEIPEKSEKSTIEKNGETRYENFG